MSQLPLLMLMLISDTDTLVGLPVSSKAQKTEPNSSAHRSTAAASTKQGRQVHNGVQCNSCSISPIRGARFRSQVSATSCS